LPRKYEPKNTVPLYRAASRYTMRNGEAVDIGPTDGRSGLMARLRERNLLDPPEISDEEEERQWQERWSELEHMRQEELAHLERKWQQRELQKVALAFGAIDATEHERLRVSELSDDLWWEVHQPSLENAGTLELTQIQMKWHHRRQHPQTREQWEALAQDIRSAFGSRIAEGAVTLYAREKDPSALRKPLDADIWAHLTVTDWRAGNATADDGTKFFDICARIGERGRPPKRIALDDELRELVSTVINSHGGESRGLLVKVKQAILGFAEKNGTPVADETANKHAKRLIAKICRKTGK
jgi:hypothetical protein